MTVPRASLAAVLALAAAVAAGCERKADSPAKARPAPAAEVTPVGLDDAGDATGLEGIDSGIDGRGYNVLLVSVDTTRADYLGCYGNDTVKTPNVDRFAAEGTRFATCISSVPLTLPSHTCMMTGSYPYVHGARDNGIFFVSDANVTLAELFKKRGYDTHAEVAAIVLNKKYGLNQGFDTYGEVEPRHPKINLHDIGELGEPDKPDIQMEPPAVETDRKADDITDHGIELLTEQAAGGRPFFIFLHYFDPHWPHEPPEPYASEYDDGYYSEIAFFDAQFGRLLDAVKSLGLADKTLVILVSDHGEGRGDHGEYTHSTFLYDSTLHVPMIMRCPGKIAAGRVVEPQVRLIDLAPTIADFAGLERTDQMQGVSLLPLMADPAPDVHVRLDCYAETVVPQTSLNYSALRALRTDDWKYILAPRSELYDLTKDRREIFNIAGIEADRAADMRQELWDIIADSPPPPGERGAFREPDADEVRKLAALGYVSGDSMDTFAQHGESELDHFEPVGVNPRDRVETIEAWSSGLGAYRAGDYERAIASYKLFMELEPDSSFGPSYMARALTQLDRFDEAIAMFRKSLELRPDNYIDHRMLGTLLMMKGDEAGGEAAFREALGYNPEDVPTLLNLGIVLAYHNENDEALELFDKGIGLAPEQATLRMQRGMVLLELGRPDDAVADLVKSVELDATVVRAHVYLAAARYRTGRTDEAIEGLDDAIAAMPDAPMLYQKRAEIYTATDRLDLAGDDFAKVVELAPDNAMAVQNRGSNLLSQGDYAGAIEWLLKALDLRADFPLAQANLAAAYESAGRLDEAAAAYDKLLQVAPRSPGNYVRAANVLAMSGNTAGALEVLRRGYAVMPDNVMIANDLAWRLATAPDDGLRDGAQAVALAEYVNDLMGGESCTELDTLAAAYAEVGRFDDAVSAAERALSIARETSQDELAGEIESRLDLFRQGKPYRLQ